MMCVRYFVFVMLIFMSVPLQATTQHIDSNRIASPDAYQLVKAAIDNWRGVSSYADMSMTIHRPDWQRSMRISSWTRGTDHSLVRVTEPRKDSGNATLVIGSQMWSYNPRINRVIKIPSSMMNQSWMGSDFSNRDIAREDEILDEYIHTLVSTELIEEQKVYTIESVPRETAAVVWGREVLRIRDDDVLLSHAFYDQDNQLVKIMETESISWMSGRSVASLQRMRQLDKDNHWTEIRVHKVQFDVPLSENTFSLGALRNPALQHQP